MGPYFHGKWGFGKSWFLREFFHQISFQKISLLAGEHFPGEESEIQENVERGQGMHKNQKGAGWRNKTLWREGTEAKSLILG